MKNNTVYNWVLTICVSDGRGSNTQIVEATTAKIKRYLMDVIKNDRKNYKEGYDYGTTGIRDLDNTGDIYFFGFNQYSDYHVDYEAYRLDMIERITLEEG